MFPNEDKSSSSADDCSNSSCSGAESHKGFLLYVLTNFAKFYLFILELEISQLFYEQKTLDQLLQENGMSEYRENFQREKITIDSFAMLTEEDLLQLQIPMGPRKILMKLIVDRSKSVNKDESIYCDV